jgi:rubrerythrin
MTLIKEPLYKGGYSGLPHIGHRQHLCHLAEYGEATLNEIKTLVRDAKWICRICGRVANNAENVCAPVPLE